VNFLSKIEVGLTMGLSKHGYDFLGVVDLKETHDDELEIIEGEARGYCQECGNTIRYEMRVKDEKTKNIYVLGRICMFKLYIFHFWKDQIEEKDLENADLLRAGRWLWVLHRDYRDREYELPMPGDYENYKDLANAVRSIVFKFRKEEREDLKKERKKKQKLETISEVLNYLGVDGSLCSDIEVEFLLKVHKYMVYGWNLSEKQTNWYKNIKNRKRGETSEIIDNEKAKKEILELINNMHIWDSLSKWEKEFVESLSNKINSGRCITKKQYDKLSDVKKKIKKYSENYEYSGKKLNPWIVKQKFGEYLDAAISSVKEVREKAIFCDVVIIDGSIRIVHEDVWIPKSQIREEVIL